MKCLHLLWLVATLFMSATAASSVHPLSGNVRFQIGDGLPVPATFTPAPRGRVEAIPGAVVTQTGSDPMRLKIPNGAMKEEPIPFVVPIAVNSVNPYQIQTSMGVTFPSHSTVQGSFFAGGRTGATSMTAPTTSAPSCSDDTCILGSRCRKGGRLSTLSATKSAFCCGSRAERPCRSSTSKSTETIW